MWNITITKIKENKKILFLLLVALFTILLGFVLSLYLPNNEPVDQNNTENTQNRQSTKVVQNNVTNELTDIATDSKDYIPYKNVATQVEVDEGSLNRLSQQMFFINTTTVNSQIFTNLGLKVEPWGDSSYINISGNSIEAERALNIYINLLNSGAENFTSFTFRPKKEKTEYVSVFDNELGLAQSSETASYELTEYSLLFNSVPVTSNGNIVFITILKPLKEGLDFVVTAPNFQFSASQNEFDFSFIKPGVYNFTPFVAEDYQFSYLGIGYGDLTNENLNVVQNGNLNIAGLLNLQQSAFYSVITKPAMLSGERFESLDSNLIYLGLFDY